MEEDNIFESIYYFHLRCKFVYVPKLRDSPYKYALLAVVVPVFLLLNSMYSVWVLVFDLVAFAVPIYFCLFISEEGNHASCVLVKVEHEMDEAVGEALNLAHATRRLLRDVGIADAKNHRWSCGKDALTYVDRSLSKLRNKLATLSPRALQETIDALRESNASTERKYQDLLKDYESLLSDLQRFRGENEDLRRKLKIIGEKNKNEN